MRRPVAAGVGPVPTPAEAAAAWQAYREGERTSAPTGTIPTAEQEAAAFALGEEQEITVDMSQYPSWEQATAGATDYTEYYINPNAANGAD